MTARREGLTEAEFRNPMTQPNLKSPHPQDYRISVEWRDERGEVNLETFTYRGAGDRGPSLAEVHIFLGSINPDLSKVEINSFVVTRQGRLDPGT